MDQQTGNVLKQAFMLLKAGKNQDAQILLVKILQSDPNVKQAWYLLSFCVSEPERKSYVLKRALQIDANFSDARQRLADLEKPEDRSSISPSAPAQNHIEQQLTQAQSFLQNDNPDAAQRLLLDILGSNPHHVRAWYLMSYAVPTKSEQIHALRQALQIQPDFPEAVARLQELQTPKKVVTPVTSFPEAEVEFAPGGAIPQIRKSWPENLKRLTKYTLYKGVMLFFTVAIGVYITILIANFGGYIDEIFRGQIAESIMGMSMGGAFDDVPVEERDARIAEIEWQMEENMGLHDPFLLRTFGFLFNGLTLNFGEAYLSGFFRGVFRSASSAVQEMVLQRLPYTILLVGVANFLFFFVSVFIALFLSRRYGGLLDRIGVILASLMTAPSWIYGIILVVVMAGELRLLPFPKVIDLKYAEMTPEYIRLILSQMIMPVLAIFLSVIFTGIFTWRTFFLIYSGEDYVEMARAQGLSNRIIERRYILRPSMPYVITSFAMMMIGLWESSIALEVLFNWPGIGNLFYQAASHFNNTSISLIVAIVVVFAYLLAITVFLLDIIYALIDPRVRIASNNQKLVSVKSKKTWRARLRRSKPAEQQASGLQTAPLPVTDVPKTPRIPLGQRVRSWFRPGSGVRSTLREVVKYPSAVVGLVIILALVGVSIYTVFAIPYSEAVFLWQSHNPDSQGRTYWYQNPHNARPVWVNFFRSDKLPETIIRNSRDESIEKTVAPSGKTATETIYSFNFDYPYSEFPVEMLIYFASTYQEKLPNVSMTWLTPDGREIRIGSLNLEPAQTYRIDQDERLERKLRGVPIIQGLLGDPEQEYAVPLQGTYELQISALTFEEDSNVDAEMIIYGQVSGLAGTDNQRRDLMVALLWGAPVALAFGFMGAIVTSLISMLIAAVGVWYGGWVDEVIQRITEVNIILPTLPVAIMVFIMYSKSIWAILGVIVLLNIFGNAIKNYRAVFLQVKEAGYIEGALAYGASNSRIILRYLVPRIIPVLIPQLVIMVPGFVFYEATLAYLGLSDPQLPTWGKVIYDAVSSGLYQGNYYWVLQPVALLVLTGLAFALLGFALDRVINPRLRDI